MSISTITVDSAASATLSTTAVIPVLNGAVTGTGNANAAMVTLADLASFFVGIDGPFIMTAATATPSAFTSTTFEGFSSTISGAAIMGYGTTNDVTLMNRAGTPVIGITANTTGVTMAGALAITGALSGVTTLGVSTSATVTSASAVALAVGLAGATNPAFLVDSSTASQAAGLKVTGAATGGTVAIVAIDSGAATNLTINAKGTGTIGIGSVSTGAVTITPATTISGAVTVNAASQLGTAAGTDVTTIGGTGYGAGVASIRLNGLTTAAVNNQVGTITNAPSAGNPVFWIPINIAGSVRYIPAWA